MCRMGARRIDLFCGTREVLVFLCSALSPDSFSFFCETPSLVLFPPAEQQ